MEYILYYKKDKTLKYTKDTNVIFNLYYQKAKIPPKKHINKYMSKNSDKITEYFKQYGIKEGINKIKRDISKIEETIPLYDPYSKNLYLINKMDVYNRVVHQYYRFPDYHMYQELKKKYKKMEPKMKQTKKQALEKNLGEFETGSQIHYRKLRKVERFKKLNLMIQFLKSFDLDIMLTTYIKVFYYYSNEVGKNLILCLRPSFLPHFRHITPYYTRSELINIALNMELIKPDESYYDSKEVKKLCKIIKKNDISKEILLNHQLHIIKKDKVGLVQYYSLQGSYFVNEYMRGYARYKYQNRLLEDKILSVWNLVNNAPKFDKSYTLYRFIQDDPHLRDLKIGSKYTVPGFMSTTRDPFYRSDTYDFGFILIKVKIPKGIKGVALCMETISHFPSEQEIILSPLSILKLVKKDENASYYHTDDKHESKIRIRYEFEYIGKKKILIPKREKYIDHDKPIDFLKLKINDTITMEERIKIFLKKYVNPMFQFKYKIKNKTYTMITEWYDSTGAYKDFYASTTDNGFCMYTMKDNYITFMIELGEDDVGPYMYVNYYFKYSVARRQLDIDVKDFIYFLATVGYYFKVNTVIIYADYLSCDFINEIKDALEHKYQKYYYGGNYCVDIYNYLKDGMKKYDKKIDSTVLKPQFKYYQLDRLKKINPIKILKKSDRDEIYQIYHQAYKNYSPKERDNLADFYIWMVNNYCFILDELVKKMHRLFSDENPFENDYYILDSGAYLYNNEYISILPKYDQEYDVERIKKSKNEYRLNPNRRQRRLTIKK